MSDDPWHAILGSGAPPTAPATAPAPLPSIAAQPGADPWHSILGPGAAPPPPPAAAPAAPVTAAPTGAPTPSAEPGGDWLPGSVWLRHINRVFENALTSGTADYLGNLPGTGTNVAAERAKTQAAGQAVGPIASGAANVAGYAMGPGKILGPLSGGSAVGEGLMAGAGSTLGQGDTSPLDIAKSAGEGALGGKIGQTVGKYGGALIRGTASKLGIGGDPAAVTAALEQAKTDAYSPFDNAFYHPADLGVGVGKVKASIYGADPTLSVNSPLTKNLLDKYGDALDKAATNQNAAGGFAPQATTGASLNDTIQKLSKIANTNTNNFEGVAAQQARDGLTDLFHSTTPVSAPAGFDPVKQLAAAKIANGQFKDAEALQGWQKEIYKYGGNVGNDVKNYNEKWYGDPRASQTPAQQATTQAGNDALMGIYNTQQQSGAVPRWATSLLHEGIGAAVGEGAGTMAGLPHGVGAGLGMIGTYAIGKPLIKAGRALSQGIDTQQAFDQAYPAMTGRNLTPVDTVGLGEAIRRLGIVAATNR
jgi:hypothetical protein